MVTPFLQDPDVTLWHGDVLDVLAQMPDGSVDCVVTSPPYWGLRDYGTGAWEGGDEACDHLGPPKASDKSGLKNDGRPPERVGQNEYEREATVPFRDICGKCGARRVDNQLGLEPTPDAYVQRMVEVFREVRRVLAPHGTCWVNLGDSYASAWACDRRNVVGAGSLEHGKREDRPNRLVGGLKEKDLVGIPWRVAFALQADGWWLRSDIVWAKPNPMPESVTDRPTKAHEYVFLLTKQPRYWFDQEAVREPAEWARWGDQTNDKHEGSGSAAGWIKSKSKAELQRPQARRAVELFEQKGLNDEHLAAIRAVGITDVGKAQVTQDGFGKNGAEVMRLAAEAKQALGGYYREFLVPNGRNVRSVWTIATQPYPEAHFATYPEELVRRCVLAGTSAKGKCPECGAPWEREIERSPSVVAGGERNVGGRTDGYTRPRGGANEWALHEPPKTLGWKPSCGHFTFGHLPLPPVPCVVLDPFVGSGTTCKVARDHGRHSIGIDLNADYLELAARRLQQLSLLTAEATQDG